VAGSETTRFIGTGISSWPGAAFRLLRRQGKRGSIVSSLQEAVVAGKNAAATRPAKAAELHPRAAWPRREARRGIRGNVNRTPCCRAEQRIDMARGARGELWDEAARIEGTTASGRCWGQVMPEDIASAVLQFAPGGARAEHGQRLTSTGQHAAYTRWGHGVHRRGKRLHALCDGRLALAAPAAPARADDAGRFAQPKRSRGPRCRCGRSPAGGGANAVRRQEAPHRAQLQWRRPASAGPRPPSTGWWAVPTSAKMLVTALQTARRNG